MKISETNKSKFKGENRMTIVHDEKRFKDNIREFNQPKTQ